MPLAPATRWIGAKADTAPPPCALATATSSSSKRITIPQYVYFSVRDDGDNGSIIDLAMQRKSLNLGQARKDPRPWIGRDAAILPAFPALPISTKDRLKVDSAFRRIVDASRHPYLEDERRVPTALLETNRFAGRIKRDGFGHAVFPHFNLEGALLF